MSNAASPSVLTAPPIPAGIAEKNVGDEVERIKKRAGAILSFLEAREEKAQAKVWRAALRVLNGELGEVKEEEVIQAWQEELLPAFVQLNDNPMGYSGYYELVWGEEWPEHCWDWANLYYEAHEEGMYSLIEAFRGSIKSTFNSLFVSFRVGHEPAKINLIISSSDDKVKEIGELIANVIKYNKAWQRIFPHVVPDEQGHWSVEAGYSVWDNRVPYPEWTQKTMVEGGRAPTVKVASYNSQYLPGPHPTGVLMIDDIHTEKNSESQRELLRVKSVVTRILVPVIEPETWFLINGTPFNFADVVAWAKINKRFKSMSTPVRKEDGTPAWPQKWNEGAIERQRETMNDDVAFAQMYELNLEKAKGQVLKKVWLEPYFPAAETKPKDWLAFGFIDYTSTSRPDKQQSDYFSLAIGLLPPRSRFLLLVDGIYARLDQDDAQELAVAKILEYPKMMVVGVEALFSWKEYQNTLAQNQYLLSAGIVPRACRGGPWAKSKGYRFEKILAPRFKSGMVRITDEENEYLNALKSEWVGWQGDALAALGHDDALDTAFGALWMAMPYLPVDEYSINTVAETLNLEAGGGEQKVKPDAMLQAYARK